MNALQIMSPQKNKPDWSRIEMNWLKLPSMFKVFHDNYDLSTVGNYFRFAYTQDGNVETFGFYTHPVIRNIIIDQFFELENLKDQLSISLNLEYEEDLATFNEHIIPIAADHANGALLMLGVGEENSDKIYCYVRHLEERLKLIADNVFEFFKDYEIKIDEAYLNDIDFRMLYRNWGDKFWRVRKNTPEV